MKNVFTLLLMLLIINSAEAQTKEDTERWILYQMSDIFYTSDPRILMLGGKNSSSFQYKIVDEYFVIIKSTESEGNPTKKTFSVLNLKDIINVDVECNIDRDIFEPHKDYAQITFSLKDGDKWSVYENIEYSGDSLFTKQYIEKRIQERYAGFGVHTQMYFGLEPSVKPLCTRIKKAFLHLAELNGAKVIKDIF